MQKIKTQKGITLIALIITIIVMLILVAVTLVITLGENGIIAKAREAKNTQALRQEAEKLELGANAGNNINALVEDGTPWNLNTSGEKEEYYTYDEIIDKPNDNTEFHRVLKVCGEGSEAKFVLYCQSKSYGVVEECAAINVFESDEVETTVQEYNDRFETDYSTDSTTIKAYVALDDVFYIAIINGNYYLDGNQMTKGGQIYFNLDEAEFVN